MTLICDTNILVLGTGFISNQIAFHFRSDEGAEVKVVPYREIHKLSHTDLNTKVWDVVIVGGLTRHLDNTARAVDYNLKQLGAFLEIMTGRNIVRSIVFFSSTDVYVVEQGDPRSLHESSPVTARDSYSESKLLSEEMLSSWAYLEKIPEINLRIPGVYGDMINRRSALDKMIYDATSHSVVWLENGGHMYRSYIFVKDILFWLQLYLKSRDDLGVLNLCPISRPIYCFATDIAQVLPGVLIQNSYQANLDRNFHQKFSTKKMYSFFPDMHFTNFLVGLRQITVSKANENDQ